MSFLVPRWQSASRRLGARRLITCCSFLALAADAAFARGEELLVPIDRVTIAGNSKTAGSTIEDLLPRRSPAAYSRAELIEFERRLNNLGIFDRVGVERRGRELYVSVREKWTIVPEVDFSSGKTLEDSYVLVGATEYNLLGSAHQLGLTAYREQRGYGVTLGFSEHDYQRLAWAFAVEASVGTVELRFDDASAWQRTSVSLDVSWRSPPWLHEYFNYVAGFYGSYDAVHDVERATAPPSTTLLQSYMEFSWDAYEWHDLVPSGAQATLWLAIGGVFGGERAEPLHTGGSSLRAALPLGDRTVLATRSEVALVTRGNVNYSTLLGSINGVRGLRDAHYFNWVQWVSNVELRHSIELWDRWALQGVTFTDAAVFEQMSEDGGRGAAGAALAVGAGARVVPTWLSTIVFRLDVSRLLTPEPAWFSQIGLNQYF